MKEIKILCADDISTFILPGILAKISSQSSDCYFDVDTATVDHTPDDVDISIFPCSPKIDNYLQEKIADFRFNLYASPAYLEKKGCPKKMDDLKDHTVLRLGKADVYSKFAHSF